MVSLIGLKTKPALRGMTIHTHAHNAFMLSVEAIVFLVIVEQAHDYDEVEQDSITQSTAPSTD